MQEKEPIPKDTIEYIAQSLISQRTTFSDTSFAPEPMEIYASPEEGARLIRMFIRIKQPNVRAAIIELATQMAEGRTPTNPVKSNLGRGHIISSHLCDCHTDKYITTASKLF